ncbi:hypothetical protein O0I10_011429 [Lichtheimia ornata]|uniref:Uncharacterized protein n=1 Tax=Lichtheimia ornata TaxID=688661 RepID=A0AAD7XSM9_9FUNG|nr:uncharacterized protein O0I10_011429 [Lichtheimia ornata]KAJ8652895.1 hypothetical protein O0I10_011429 [Lichtheimia ornata]
MFYRLANRTLSFRRGSASGTPPKSTSSFKPRPFADLPGSPSSSTFTQRVTLAAVQGFDRAFPLLEGYLCLLYITGAFQSSRSADDDDEKQPITKYDQSTTSSMPVTTGGFRIGHFKITILQRLSFHSNGGGGLGLSMHESPKNGNQSTFFVPSFYSLLCEKQGSSSSSSLFQRHYYEQFHSP